MKEMISKQRSSWLLKKNFPCPHPKTVWLLKKFSLSEERKRIENSMKNTHTDMKVSEGLKLKWNEHTYLTTDTANTILTISRIVARFSGLQITRT